MPQAVNKSSGGLKWGAADAGQFTVNLAVTAPCLYYPWTGRPFPTNPATALFPISTRIGLRMMSGCDGWWRVDSHTDPAEFARDAALSILKHGLPFFDEFPSKAAILAKLRSSGEVPGLTSAQKPIVHAMLAVDEGKPAEAKALLAGAYANADASPVAETILLVAQRLALALPAVP